MKKILLFLLLIPLLCNAQTSIQGVVNIYVKVTYVGGNYAVVTSTSGFMINDITMPIQMKGAIVDTNNASSFGSVQAYNYAGDYEFLRIRCISNDTIYFSSTIVQKYDVNSSVQLVRVPEYTNATVIDTLKGQKWNGVCRQKKVYQC